MRRLSCGLTIASLLLASHLAVAADVPCPDLLFPDGQCAPDPKAAVEACCDCNGFDNHGLYVRCVAHAAKALGSGECIDRDTHAGLRRCAARSTCGKPGFVTCCKDRPGVCEEGFCAATVPPIACTTSEECPAVVTTCKLARDADLCVQRGGTPGSAPSCCDACGQ